MCSSISTKSHSLLPGSLSILTRDSHIKLSSSYIKHVISLQFLMRFISLASFIIVFHILTNLYVILIMHGATVHFCSEVRVLTKCCHAGRSSTSGNFDGKHVLWIPPSSRFHKTLFSVNSRQQLLLYPKVIHVVAVPIPWKTSVSIPALCIISYRSNNIPESERTLFMYMSHLLLHSKGKHLENTNSIQTFI